MSAVPSVTVGGNDLTDFIQYRSFSVKRQAVDVTFIDPSDIPALGDSLVVTDPAWTGTVVSTESAAMRKGATDTVYWKVRATNAAIPPDLGAAPYDLDANFKNMVVTRTRNGTTDEVRAECIVYVEGLEIGHEIEITYAPEGFSSETFTILDITTEWPTHDDEATYALAMGLGDYATAMTGAADGGPLDHVELGGPRGGIVQTVRNAGGCMDCPDGGGECAEVVIDDFEDRDLSGGDIAGSWGLTNGWQYFDDTGNDAGVYVSGLDGGWPGGGDHQVGGLIREVSSGAGAYMRTIVGIAGPWTKTEWIIRWRVAWEVYADAGPVLAVVTDGSGSAGVQIGGSSIVLSDVEDDVAAEASFTFDADTPYYVQIHYKKNTILEAKVWACADSEPGSYMVNGVPTMEGDLSSYLYIHGPGDPASEEAFEVDEIRKMCPA